METSAKGWSNLLKLAHCAGTLLAYHTTILCNVWEEGVTNQENAHHIASTI